VQGADAARGVRVAVCAPSSGGTIDLTSPVDDRGGLGRELAGFLRGRGEGMYALVLESPDPDATAGALRAKGIDLRPSATDPKQWEIDAAAVHGARMLLEARSVAI
jgi:hypothetical protein